MQLYLRPIGNLNQYTDDGFYDNGPPFQAPEGFEWVEGTPPENATIYIKPSLHNRLKAILETLPDSVQAQFGTIAAAIDLAIQNGSPNVAILELQSLTLPSDLEPIRTHMIQEINNG